MIHNMPDLFAHTWFILYHVQWLFTHLSVILFGGGNPVIWGCFDRTKS